MLWVKIRQITNIAIFVISLFWLLSFWYFPVDCVALVAALSALGELSDNTKKSESPSPNVLSIPDIVREFRTAASSLK